MRSAGNAVRRCGASLDSRTSTVPCVRGPTVPRLMIAHPSADQYGSDLQLNETVVAVD